MVFKVIVGIFNRLKRNSTTYEFSVIVYGCNKEVGIGTKSTLNLTEVLILFMMKKLISDKIKN